MNTSKQILELEKRKERAEDVTVRLTSSTTTGYNFDVYTNNLLEKVKYLGTITENHLGDSCTCHSFTHGNSENYVKTNPLPFQCKHIIGAHFLMEGYWS